MLSKIKKSLKNTKTKILTIIIVLVLIASSIGVLSYLQNSKADVPYSLMQELYAYTEDVDANPAYTVKIVLYQHPDRMYSESYVEYYLNGSLVKTEKFR